MKTLIAITKILPNDTKEAVKERVLDEIYKFLESPSNEIIKANNVYIGGDKSGFLSLLANEEETYQKYSELYIDFNFKVEFRRKFTSQGNEDDIMVLNEMLYEELKGYNILDTDDYERLEREDAWFYFCIDKDMFEITEKEINKCWAVLLRLC